MGFNMNHTTKPDTFTSLLILETISSCTICLEVGGILFLFMLKGIILFLN